MKYLREESMPSISARSPGLSSLSDREQLSILTSNLMMAFMAMKDGKTVRKY